MASTDDLVSAGGVLLILLAGVVYNRLQAARASPAEVALAPGEPATLLGRYASHRGHVLGEVVAVTADHLILRQGTTHLAVPGSKARLREGELILTGDLDLAQAEAAGQAWNRASAPVLSSAISAAPDPWTGAKPETQDEKREA